MTHDDVDFAFFTVGTTPRTYCVLTRGQKFSLRGRVLLWSRRESANGATMADDNSNKGIKVDLDWPEVVAQASAIVNQASASYFNAREKDRELKQISEANAIAAMQLQLELARTQEASRQKDREHEASMKEKAIAHEASLRAKESETQITNTRIESDAREKTIRAEQVEVWKAKKAYAEAVAASDKEVRISREITLRWMGTFAVILLCGIGTAVGFLLKFMPGAAVGVVGILSAGVSAWRASGRRLQVDASTQNPMVLPEGVDPRPDANNGPPAGGAS
jgi:hypothetical protein